MIIGLISLVVFFALAILRFQWASRVLVLLLPAYLVRFSIFGIPFTLLEGMILILFCAWVGRVIVFREGRKLILPWKWVILFFLAAATASVFVAPELKPALGLWKAYFIEPVLLFLVLVNTVKKTSEKRWLVYALGLSAIFISLYAAGQYLGFFKSPAPWINETPKRVSSVFDYPNAVGLYLTPIVVLFLSFFAFKRAAANRLFTAFVVILGLAAIFFSFTRGAILGFAAALVFLGFVSERKKLIWLIIAVTIGTSLILPASRHVINSVVSVKDTSTDVRVVLWQGTWNLLKAHPWLGAGLGGFPALYDKYRLIKHTELLLYPHNIFLNFWVETGLAGLIAFLGILLSFFRRGIRAIHTDKSRICGYSLMASMIALVVYGLVEAPYFKNDLSALFWVLCALVVIASRHVERDDVLSPEAAERLKKNRMQV
ncbi:MAG: O-antigen ligase family protein [Patescibacteria group bacterium]